MNASVRGDEPVARRVTEDALRGVLVPGERPPRPEPRCAASLTFGWRAMLKIKHVPEQLFDVTMFPIMFTLMFTYLFGGALAGSTQRVPAVPPARHPGAWRRDDHRCTPVLR